LSVRVQGSLLVACAALPAGAQPTLQDLVREALANHPALGALHERLAAARELIAPAGALPDPMVELTLTEAATSGFPRISLGEEPMSMFGVELRQGLLRGRKRDAARDVVRADVAVREREVELLRREIAREVRRAYARIYALDRRLELLPPARELIELLIETTMARYAAGQTDQGAVLAAQLALSRLAEDEADVRAERGLMLALLGRLLDRPGALDLPPVVELPPIEFPAGSFEEQALAASAEAAARGAEVDAARRRLAAARLELQPDLFAAGATAYREALDPVITLGLGLEWPLWRRHKQLPRIRAAEHELARACAELRVTESMVREAARGIAVRRDLAERQIVLYREALVPQSQAALDAARAEYLAGRGDFATAIEDFRMWLEARTQLVQREAERFAAWADHQWLLADAPAQAHEEANR